MLAAAPVHAIGFGFTSSAYVLGLDGERAMVERLRRRTRDIPVVAASTSVIGALQSLGVERVSAFDPPWFDAELSALGRQFYTAAGFAVVHSGPCGLPSDQARITPEGLHDWVVQHVPADAEAIAIGGNGFRAVGVISALESTLDRPVVTANQALFWAALRAAGGDPTTVTGYGRLFAVTH
jgi:maleate isomerase